MQSVFARNEGITSFRDQLANKLFAFSVHDQLDAGWQLTNDGLRTLFTRLMATGKPLTQVVEGHMYYGVKTGLNEAFMINQVTRDELVKNDPIGATLIKRFVRGEDLRPWFQENEERWLIFTRRGIDINSFPAIFAYLQQYREQLEPRPYDWNSNHRWLGRKSGSYKWYETQDPIEYYEAFKKPKLSGRVFRGSHVFPGMDKSKL